MEKKEYRNATESKTKIKRATLSVLKHTRGVLPSISDITQQAGLSRSTFYHHYETVMDVVVDIHRDLMRDLDDR